MQRNFQSFLFKLILLWRISYGVLRVILGISLMSLIGLAFSDIITTLMAHELSGKFGDIVFEKLYDIFEIHDFTVTYFISFYFIFWGIIDIILSLCLLKKIMHAFPIAMYCIIFFIIYGTVRFTYTHSIILLSIIFLDSIILYLIDREYTTLKKTQEII